MSLQNLLKPNNYELHLGDTSISSLSIDELNPIPPSTDIIVNANLYTVGDDAVSLGKAGQGFSNLFARNLCGIGGEVNAIYGINGNSYTGPPAGNYSVYFPNGLSFQNAASLNNSQKSLSYYQEYTGNMTVGNLSAPFQTPFSAVRIGNILNISIQSFGTSPALQPTAAANGPLTFTSIVSPSAPALPVPTSDQYVITNTVSNNTYPLGCMVFGSDGTIKLYTNPQLSSSFTAGQQAGLSTGNNNSNYVSFSILLN